MVKKCVHGWESVNFKHEDVISTYVFLGEILALDATRNQDLQTLLQNLRCGGILIQNRNQNNLLCAIVFDCIDCL